MTTEQEFDGLLRSWFDSSAAPRQPDELLESVLTTTAKRRPRPAWLVRLGGEPMPQSGRSGINQFAAIGLAAALLVALLIGIATIGRSPNVGPSPVPNPSVISTPTQAPTPTPSPEPSPAGWTSTGSMAYVHAGHSATLLHDGRVLVVGDGSPGALPELYDPNTGRWSTTAKMVVHRQAGGSPVPPYTTTLLRDGRVLVAGGTGDDGGDLSAAELFDPTAGRWSATGSMTTIRSQHTATLLPDGKVLVTGGIVTDRTFLFPILASAELYDPRTGRWTPTGSMATARMNHAATLLPDGRVLVAGGSISSPDGSYTTYDSGELYDPSSGQWAATGSMGEARWGHTTTLLANGRVLVLGGSINGSGGGSPAPELFDPSTGRWTATRTMTTVRSDYTATLLPDGRVLVAGGMRGPRDGDQIPLASAELYDPNTGRWTATANMAQARSGHAATLLADGRVLVTGGVARDPDRGGEFIGLVSAELYAPSTGN